MINNEDLTLLRIRLALAGVATGIASASLFILNGGLGNLINDSMHGNGWLPFAHDSHDTISRNILYLDHNLPGTFFSFGLIFTWWLCRTFCKPISLSKSVLIVVLSTACFNLAFMSSYFGAFNAPIPFLDELLAKLVDPDPKQLSGAFVFSIHVFIGGLLATLLLAFGIRSLMHKIQFKRVLSISLWGALIVSVLFVP